MIPYLPEMWFERNDMQGIRWWKNNADTVNYNHHLIQHHIMWHQTSNSTKYMIDWFRYSFVTPVLAEWGFLGQEEKEKWHKWTHEYTQVPTLFVHGR